MTAQATTEHTVIDLPGASNGFLIALAVIAAGLVATIAMMLVGRMAPIHISGLLAVVAAGCIVLIVLIADQMLGARLTVTDDVVIVSRLIGGGTYPWHKIEEVKVIAPTNSLGDNPFAETTRRLGLGLFLHGTGRNRESTLDADVILCAVAETRLEMLVALVERLNRMRPKSSFRPAVAAAPPKKIGAKKSDFRQRGAKIAAH